ncbi:MAG: PIN domain-containing protein [Acidobacteria bacterium]|nr:PIN domain-containing protein [Acidobacteriota bacterium]
MRLVLVDSSAFLSLKHPRERSHASAREALDALVREGARLVTTNFVFDETYTLFLARLGRPAAVAWGASFLGGRLCQLVRVDERHESRAWEIILGFPDKDFSYTDATSFAVAEELGIEEAFALDRHFRQFRQFGLRVLP